MRKYIIYLSIFLLLLSCNSNPDQESSDIRIQDRELNAVPKTLQPEADPFVVDIEQATLGNENYRKVSWTGEHMQLVFMSLAPGEEIHLEKHDDLDQFIRLEQGQAQIRMGQTRDELTFESNMVEDWAALIPAGFYHHVKNIGDTTLKLYTLYGPGAHPEETVHKTYQEARDHEEQEAH